MIVNDRFENLGQFDCMVSTANSFGLMDGGVDLAIISSFGIELMDRVQAMVIDEFFGEQPIGTSVIVETGHPRHPYIAHTPTMRVPMSIVSTDNVYTAMWALLVAIAQHNKRGAQDRHCRMPWFGNGNRSDAGGRGLTTDGGGLPMVPEPAVNDQLAICSGTTSNHWQRR